jgi:NAD(P)H-hydrate epimerase
LEGLLKTVVDEINTAPAKVVAIDIPSGISADTGEILGTAVKAHTTVALAYMKVGLTKEPAHSLAGRIVVKDIGIYC